MIIYLKNGEQLEITIRKNEKGTYEFYIRGKKIGVLTPKVMQENILILENTVEKELENQIKDVINKIDREEIERESYETKQIDTYMRKIGQRNKNIKEIRKIKMNEQETDSKEQKDGKQEKIVNKEEKSATIKDVNIKQEIELNERANDMHDIRKWLGGKIPKEIQKIGVIESEQMDNIKDEKGKKYKKNTTRYSLITIDKDGNVEPLSKYIPELKQRDAAGNNPIEEKFQVRDDGRVEKDAILSEYEIGNKIIQLDNKKMGRVEMNIGEEEHGGNETMGVQVRDSNTPEVPSTEVRSTIGEYERNGEYTVNKNIKEAKEHMEENPGCNKMNQKDIDGNSSTKSHEHLDNIDYRKLAIRWGYRDDNGKPDEIKAKEVLENKAKNSPDKSKRELIELIDEELNEQVIF